jgi:hypothetical protein
MGKYGYMSQDRDEEVMTVSHDGWEEERRMLPCPVGDVSSHDQRTLSIVTAPNFSHAKAQNRAGRLQVCLQTGLFHS